MAGDAQLQNRRIHELVEQSRDRVVHVRAGQRLLDVLDATTDHDAAAGAAFPPPAASALVPQQRAALHNAASNASDASGLRAAMRKRAAVVLRAPPARPNAATRTLSSSEQFTFYAASKLTHSESLNMLERRKAVPLGDVGSSKQLAKLVSKHEATRATTQTPTSPLVQAVAAVKGRNAFLKLKDRARLRTKPRVREVAKNTHMAFLEFKASGGSASPTRESSEREMAQLNAATREPLRFGDAVCMLSLASNLPLAVGRNGRTMCVHDAVMGPHMVFTLIDFRNPSRRDDVLVGEPFWLRIDASQLDVDEPDEILTLLMDTHYYLGGPGPLEDEEGETAEEQAQHYVGAAGLRAPSRKSSTRTPGTSHGRRRRPHDQSFKLVAMKASVPSAAYYGDDTATREYAVETNANVVRLAQWRFVEASVADTNNYHHRHPRGRKGGTSHRRRRGQHPELSIHQLGDDSDRNQANSSDNDGDDSDHNNDTGDQLVLNCASVGLALGELALEFEPQRRRGVLRGSLTRDEQSEPHFLRPLERRESCAWQVRLMKRGEPALAVARGDEASPTTRQKQRTKPPPPPSSPVGKRRPPSQQESLEWLQFRRDRVERDAKRVEQKRSLAREAHAAYDTVAERSNAKLLQIEKNKAVHNREYFQGRFQEVVEAQENKKTRLPRL